MSTDYFAYRVSTIDDKNLIPDVVDLDKEPFNDSSDQSIRWYDDSSCPEWVHSIGMRRSTRRETIDLFDVGRQLFGKAPQSIRYTYHNGWNYDFNYGDGDVKQLTEQDVASYHYIKESTAWFYHSEELGDLTNLWRLDMRKYANRILNRNDILDIVHDYFTSSDETDDYVSDMEARGVYALMKIYCSVSDSDKIVIVSE